MRRRRIRRFAVILATILAFTPGLVGSPVFAQEGSTTAGGVPTLGGDPARTGQHPGPGPAAAPSQRWLFTLPSTSSDSYVESRATPIVVDGVAYVGAVDKHLYAIDVATGTERWRAPTEQRISSAPTFDQGTVYAVAFDTLYAFDVATGTPRWTFKAAGGFATTPAVVEGVVYAATSTSQLAAFAIDAATGDVRWQAPICPAGETSCLVGTAVAVAGGLIYVVGGTVGEVVAYAFDAATGEPRWQSPVGRTAGHVPSPVVANGIVYLAAQGVLVALDAASGGERWRITRPLAGAYVAVSADTVYLAGTYLGDPIAALYALEAATGTERWQAITTGESIVGSPVLVGQTLYVVTAGIPYPTPSSLIAVDAPTGAEQWRVQTAFVSITSPVVFDGAVYVAGGNLSQQPYTGGLQAFG